MILSLSKLVIKDRLCEKQANIHVQLFGGRRLHTKIFHSFQLSTPLGLALMKAILTPTVCLLSSSASRACQPRLALPDVKQRRDGRKILHGARVGTASTAKSIAITQLSMLVHSAGRAVESLIVNARSKALRLQKKLESQNLTLPVFTKWFITTISRTLTKTYDPRLRHLSNGNELK